MLRQHERWRCRVQVVAVDRWRRHSLVPGDNMARLVATEGDSFLSIDTVVQNAIGAFEEKFERKPSYAAAAPGRVNLIGEHTDYCDGYVFPMGLPMVTAVVGNSTDTGVCRVLTTASGVDEPKYIEFPLPSAGNPLLPSVSPFWVNYVKGVVAHYKGCLKSFDATIATSVPLGGGVSSSAALEVATHTFLEAMETDDGYQGDLKAKALTCQKAEHTFAGMPCGIMDQFISVMAKEGYALLLDCKLMKGSLVPLNDPDLSVVICNSHVKHELSNSEYPVRKAQTEKASEILGVEKLREASMTDLEACKNKMENVIYQRALHVIGENQRCLDGAEALKKGDYEKFGQLMVESHSSLRDNYAVSCDELDILVAAALEVEGVYGSRMTGGGFGGCTVTLVKSNAIKNLLNHIREKYTGKTTCYVVKPSEGARIISI